MIKPDFSPTLLSMKEMNLHQKLKYLTFLQKEGEETVYVAAIMCLISSFQQVLPNELEDLKVKKSLITHFTNFSGKLLVNKKYAKCLSVLEFALQQLPKNKSTDPCFQTLTTLVHNNLAVYSSNIQEYDLAVKSLHICLKKDSSLNLNLSCIFYNNLAGVYHASGNYEKAYKCAKKCVFLLQPLVFDQIKNTSAEVLKKDLKFKKSLIILLIGYLNIGASIEGHRTLDLVEGPVLREMLDADPKNYYWNSLKLATKYLGKDHFLYQRIAISFQRVNEPEPTEVDSPQTYSKKTINSDQSSDVEKNQSMRSKPSAKFFKKPYELSSPLTERALSRDKPFEDINGYQIQKTFRIRDTSLTKGPPKKHSVDITPSKTSLDATLGILSNTPRDNKLPVETNSQTQAQKNHRRYRSTTAEFNALLKKDGQFTAWPNSPAQRNIHPVVAHQPYLQTVLQQQKEMQAQMGPNYFIQKQSFPSLEVDNHEARMSLKAQEDAIKIERLQQEIDGLKKTFREFEARNFAREDSKTLSETKQPSLSFLGPQTSQPNQQEGLITLLKSSSVVSASSREEYNKSQVQNKPVQDVNKRDSFMMVLPIPTTIDALDSDMYDISTANPNPNRLKYAVFKKRVYLEDNAEYHLICRATWTKEKKLFNIELIKKSGNTHNIIHRKQLNYKELQTVLKQIQYKDALPTSFQIKEIRNFSPLIKFLLMPFISIQPNESRTHQIAITPQPSDLLSSHEKPSLKVTFLKKECRLLFLHVFNNVFRLVLADVNSAENSFRIDVEFDTESLNYYLDKTNGKQSDLKSASACLKIIQAFDDYSDESELLLAKKILERISNPDRTEEEELESYRLKNRNIIDDLILYLKDIESFFEARKVSSFKDIIDEKEIKYCKLKIVGPLRKTCLHVVWDMPQKGLFEISLNNLFETFAPNGKARVKGNSQYLYKTACKQFGVVCEKMESCDKLSLCSLIADLFMLEVFDKKLTPEEIERYDQNPITFTPFETGTYCRTYLGSQTKFPLTFSLIGIKGVPRGVKVTIYNREEITENGAFFYIDYNSWVKDVNERKKRKTYSVDPFEIIDYYHLESILKAGGWKILQEALVIDTNSKKMQIIGIKIMKGISVMEQLENVLNPESLLKLLKAKEADEE